MALTDVLLRIKLFNSRFVDKIKNSSTSTAFEKSRLMIQAFNDQEKKNGYNSIIYNLTYKSTVDTGFNCNHRAQIIFSKHFSSIRLISYFAD